MLLAVAGLVVFFTFTCLVALSGFAAALVKAVGGMALLYGFIFFKKGC